MSSTGVLFRSTAKTHQQALTLHYTTSGMEGDKIKVLTAALPNAILLPCHHNVLIIESLCISISAELMGLTFIMYIRLLFVYYVGYTFFFIRIDNTSN